MPNDLQLAADFSLASYALAGNEVTGFPYVDSENSAADAAYASLQDNGWRYLTSAELELTLLNAGASGQAAGFFINRNGAALVAVRGDTLVLSFRGTNDDSPLLSSLWYNDRYDWRHRDDHFDLFADFLVQLRDYLSNHTEISNVLITGHSLGAAMVDSLFVSEYDIRTVRPVSLTVEGVNFANPGYQISPWIEWSDASNDLTTVNFQRDVIEWAELISEEAGDYNEVLTLSSPTSSSMYHSMLGYRSFATYLSTNGITATDLNLFDGRVYVDGTVTSTGEFFAVTSAGSSLFSVDNSRSMIVGGYGSDHIYGGLLSDRLYGAEGGDDIRGRDGADGVFGGGGNDHLYGGIGEDTLFGGENNDALIGEFDADSLFGGFGLDNLFGGSGNDTLFGGSEADYLTGGVGSDSLDGGGSDQDVAVFSGASSDYSLEWVFGFLRVSANTNLLSPEYWEGIDFLSGIEFLQFSDGTASISDWLVAQNGTVVPQPAPTPAPPPPLPPPSGPTVNNLLSVTPINQTLRVGESVALSSLFSYSDSDGASDVGWVLVNDRTGSTGGYLTRNGQVMNNPTGQDYITIPLSELNQWRFVAGSTSAVDEIGITIVQSLDGDWSPRLNPGARVTTIPANTVIPPVDDHANSFGSATVMSAGVVTGFVSANGTIGTATDEDWFSVQLQAGQTYAFVLWPNSTTNSHLDPRLTVRMPDGTTRTNDNLSATTLMSFVSITATQTGTYYLRAEGVNGTTGDFILTASPVTVDPTAGGLTEGTGSTDPGNSTWQWEGTTGDDSPSELTLESGGRPQTSGNNTYRGHGGDDRISADTGDDVVWGDSGSDSLYGEEGRDTLRGGTSSDSLYGGDDHDLLYGESGDDRLSGGDGHDTLYGGDDEDDMSGGNGNDFLKGEDENDTVSGGAGDDQLYGDRGNDSIEGGSGNDFIMGGRGDDYADGGSGHDRLAGEDGNDSLDGDNGDDVVYGGYGNDTLQGREGNDVLHGEDGIDTADFFDGDDGVRVNLFDDISISTDLGTDRLYEIENVRGSGGDDIIDGDHGENVLDGYDENDNIRGHNGNDTVIGGSGNDTLWGDEGNDLVIGDTEDDELRGGLGADNLQGGGGNDHLRGEQGSDSIDGGEGNDTVFFWGEREDFSIVASDLGFVVTDLRLDGLEGQDTIAGVEFLEFFDGTAATSAVLGSAPTAMADVASTTVQTPIVLDVLENDSAGALELLLVQVEVLSGGGVAYIAGNRLVYDPRTAFDDLAPGASIEVSISYVVQSAGLLRSTGTVHLTVTSDRDSLVGDGSSNELYGYEGNDTLAGDSGNDWLDGGLGFDHIEGGADSDTLMGGDQNDTLIGGGGADSLNGGTGDRDLVSYRLSGAGVRAVLQAPASNSGDAAGDLYAGVEDLEGSAFNDTLGGDLGGNRILGGEGSDGMDGLAGADTLLGEAGNDTLIGGAGADVLDGGAGGYDGASYWNSSALRADLIYTATNTGDAAGDSYIAIENLQGSGFGDTLGGDHASNTISGLAGNDAIDGRGGNDTLGGEAGNDTLIGSGGNDLLVGGAGGDRLDGGSGTQDAASYVGSSLVRADLAYTNTNTGDAAGDTYFGIENLQGSNFSDILGGDSFANMIGGLGGNDAIDGRGGNDTIGGGGGNDTINGGVGIDLLVGNGGADTFVFNSAVGATNVDTVLDYVVVDDTIWLENAVMTGLTAGALTGAAFALGAAATTVDHRIIYNSANGQLLYDADGNGAGAAVLIATLSTGLAMAAGEFLVI